MVVKMQTIEAGPCGSGDPSRVRFDSGRLLGCEAISSRTGICCIILRSFVVAAIAADGGATFLRRRWAEITGPPLRTQ